MRHLVAFLSAAVAMLSIVGAALGGPRPFESTLAPFDPSPHKMPMDFPQRYVLATPRSDGTLDGDVGAGAANRTWYEWLKKWLRPWANARVALDRETLAFQETVKDDDLRFKAAFAKLDGVKLAQFNSKHDVQLQKALQDYVKARGREVSQAQTIKAAMSRSDQALEKVRKEEALLSAQEDIEKRASVASDKATIEKQIAESKALAEKFTGAVGTAVDLASSIKNPAEFGMKSFGVVTGLILKAAIDDHTMELFVLDLRLEELDKAILAKQKTAAEAALKEARHGVDAAAADFVKAIIDEQLIIEEQNQALDRAALLERGARASKEPNTPNIFEELRTIHTDIQLSGKSLRKSCALYLSVLNHGPGKRAAKLYPELDRLIADVRGYSVANKDEWLNVAFDSSKYMTKHAAWYPKEQEFVFGQFAALQKRVDIAPMDSYVKQILEKL